MLRVLFQSAACLVQSNPPKPSDDDVYIESRPALEVYVTSFGGWATGSSYLSHAADLTEVSCVTSLCYGTLLTHVSGLVP
jgi:hypothetical protein